MAQPRFVFRLEALLEHRRAAEKEAQRKMALAQQEVQKIVESIRDAQRRIAEENRSLTTTQLVGQLDMAAIAFGKRFVGNLHVKIAMAAQSLAAAEKAVAAARGGLLQAAKARKVIDKLREKQEKRWREELARKDAAAMDEMGTQLALRDMAERELAEMMSESPGTSLEGAA